LHNTRKTTNFAAGFAALPRGLRQPFCGNAFKDAALQLKL